MQTFLIEPPCQVAVPTRLPEPPVWTALSNRVAQPLPSPPLPSASSLLRRRTERRHGPRPPPQHPMQARRQQPQPSVTRGRPSRHLWLRRQRMAKCSSRSASSLLLRPSGSMQRSRQGRRWRQQQQRPRAPAPLLLPLAWAAAALLARDRVGVRGLQHPRTRRPRRTASGGSTCSGTTALSPTCLGASCRCEWVCCCLWLGGGSLVHEGKGHLFPKY